MRDLNVTPLGMNADLNASPLGMNGISV